MPISVRARRSHQELSSQSSEGPLQVETPLARRPPPTIGPAATLLTARPPPGPLQSPQPGIFLNVATPSSARRVA